MIEDMAARGRTQRTIAAELGVSHKKFEKMLERGKGDNEERLAWERGHAVIEQRVHDVLLASVMGDLVEEDVLGEDGAPTGEKQMVRVQSKLGGLHLMFYAKTRLGWQEKPTGPLIQENRINITIPGPMTHEEFFAATGVPMPLDYRKVKDVTPAALPSPEGVDGNR